MKLTFNDYALYAQHSSELRLAPERPLLAAAQEHAQTSWDRAYDRHARGASGGRTLQMLTKRADDLLGGLVAIALARTESIESLHARISVCALGGYGRGEMSPHSDLDVCVLYSGRLDEPLKRFTRLFITWLWDLGFKPGHSMHSVTEAAALSRKDPEVYTSYAQARLVAGLPRSLKQLQMKLQRIHSAEKAVTLDYILRRTHREALAEDYRDLYALEPDIKENVGGLRDYHAARWMLELTLGITSLDTLPASGRCSQDEYLDLMQSLDFIWRIRNELHFHTHKPENRLTFALQQHVARSFGYGGDDRARVARLMQDYYGAAQGLQRFLRFAIWASQENKQPKKLRAARPAKTPRSRYHVRDGMLCAETPDREWFVENPSRLMEVFWVSSRRNAPLSLEVMHWVQENGALVDDDFRSNDMARRFFVALCNRPLLAGQTFRQMAQAGILGAYWPEFEAVRDLVCYEHFHSYPVDEHTLRALEALAQIPAMPGMTGRFLRQCLEGIQNPHLLSLAILMHDLGKVEGEVHCAESERLVTQIGQRMGLSEEDITRVGFLVKQHMLMSNIAFYRDTNDMDVVQAFARQVKTEERMRLLILLTYADLVAVGPGVWNEWKGTLLVHLYLKAERVLLGRAASEDLCYWELPKARTIQEQAPPGVQSMVSEHLQSMGEGYFFSFAPESIIKHLFCLKKARANGIGVQCSVYEEMNMSELVVVAPDCQGLFSMISGSFVAQGIDVHDAMLFTSREGLALDCFTVRHADTGMPLTEHQVRGLEKTLQRVILGKEPVQAGVDSARRRLFALLAPRFPAPTKITFDNEVSATDTVIDIETGDRTGLLYDLTTAMTGLDMDIRAARIMTDIRHVRDAFYVRRRGAKILEAEEQAHIISALEMAILRPSAETLLEKK